MLGLHTLLFIHPKAIWRPRLTISYLILISIVLGPGYTVSFGYHSSGVWMAYLIRQLKRPVVKRQVNLEKCSETPSHFTFVQNRRDTPSLGRAVA